VKDYVLQFKSDLQSTYSTVTAYGGQPQYSLTTNDGLVEGRIYSIRWCAANQKGQGPWSEDIIVAFTDFPSPPTLI